MRRFLFFLLSFYFEYSLAAVQVNQTAPNFILTDSWGKEINLSSFKDRVVILEWTNHECPFVKKHYSTRNMQGTQEVANEERVVWFSIISSAPGTQGHVSGKEANVLTVKRGASPSNVLLDPEGDVGRMYGAKTTPHMYIIDQTGILKYQGAIDDAGGRGFASKDLAKATNFIKKALEEMKTDVPISSNTTKPYGCSIKYKS
jgi:peroxiredoxin|tara:strand:+ start:4956 stop:5561 length:606 start_codon:yes stop_codon:yes gene_type:complete